MNRVSKFKSNRSWNWRSGRTLGEIVYIVLRRSHSYHRKKGISLCSASAHLPISHSVWWGRDLRATHVRNVGQQRGRASSWFRPFNNPDWFKVKFSFLIGR